MKKILLSNIGNRNILYNNKNFDFKTDGSFKEWTKALLTNFEIEKPFLSIQIIDQLLDNDVFEEVFLFSSNQINEIKKDQDTLYEAEILKKLIEEKYQTKTSIIENQNKVIDNDAQMLFYRHSIRTINRQFPDEKIIVCDAGGTAQQKSALKIILEFFLEETQFEVFYPNPSNGLIEKVQQIQYRRIIQTEQIRKLIDIGEYKSATKLLGFDNPILCASDSKMPVKLLGLGHVLFERQWQYVLPFVKNSNHKQIKNSKLLTRILAQKSLIENDEFTLLFEENILFKLGEMLAQIQFCWHQKLFTNTIMQFAIFYETYLYEIISHELEFDLANNFDFENERLKRTAKLEFVNVAHFFGQKDIVDGVPFKIMIAENILNDCNNSFLKLLKPFISDGKDFKVIGFGKQAVAINSIRNKIAHNGRVIDKVAIKDELPYLEDLLNSVFKVFGLSQSNPYLAMNQYIVENL
jgi:hypothetical protein